MRVFIQLLIDGILLGSGYALFASGLAVEYGVVGVLNLTYPSIFACASLSAIYAVHATKISNIGFALVVAAIIGAAIGFTINTCCLRLLRRKGWDKTDRDTEIMALVATLGLFFVLTSVLSQITKSKTYNFPASTLPAHQFRVAGIVVNSVDLVMFLAALVILVFLKLFLDNTHVGKQVKAVSFNPQMARFCGINSERVFGGISILLGAFVGIAGVLIGLLLQQVSVSIGQDFLLKGLVIVVLGGLGSIAGVAVGGVLLGLTEVFVGYYWNGEYEEIVAFAVVFLLLVIRPNGLLGTEGRLRT